MTVTHKEVEKGKDATVACTVAGVTVEPTIVWKSSTGSALSSDTTNYDVTGGTGFKADTNTHESTLTVKAAANTVDATFSCVVTSAEWAKTNEENVVNVKVLGMYFF